MVPVVKSCTGSMTRPFSTCLETLNTANVIAQKMKTEVSARCKPAGINQLTFSKPIQYGNGEDIIGTWAASAIENKKLEC